MADFFADTYAFFEYLRGNQKYASYFEKHSLITSRLNLMELYYGSLLEAEEMADTYFNSFSPLAVDFSDEILKKAMKFRFINKKKKLSYVDCMGYQIALENKIKFLTGDNGFKNIKNVEFMK